MFYRVLGSASVLLLLAATVLAVEPCVSGLPPGEKPGPYSSVVCTGAQRGQPFCYICDNADRPAVIVFARHLSDPLGKLVKQLEKAVEDHSAAKLNAWVTILHKDQASIDGRVLAWGKQHAISAVPLAVFEDEAGPPSYRLHRDADVTILLFVNRKVVANFAFRKDELTQARADDVLKALPRIVGTRK